MIDAQILATLEKINENLQNLNVSLAIEHVLILIVLIFIIVVD